MPKTLGNPMVRYRSPKPLMGVRIPQPLLIKRAEIKDFQETEAKQNWQKNLESRKCKIDHIDSQTDPSNPLKKALPEWYELYHERSWRNERTKRTDHDTIKQICKGMLGEFPVMLISSDHIQKYFMAIVNNSATIYKYCYIERRYDYEI